MTTAATTTISATAGTPFSSSESHSDKSKDDFWSASFDSTSSWSGSDSSSSLSSYDQQESSECGDETPLLRTHKGESSVTSTTSSGDSAISNRQHSGDSAATPGSTSSPTSSETSGTTDALAWVQKTNDSFSDYSKSQLADRYEHLRDRTKRMYGERKEAIEHDWASSASSQMLDSVRSGYSNGLGIKDAFSRGSSFAQTCLSNSSSYLSSKATDTRDYISSQISQGSSAITDARTRMNEWASTTSMDLRNLKRLARHKRADYASQFSGARSLPSRIITNLRSWPSPTVSTDSQHLYA